MKRIIIEIEDGMVTAVWSQDKNITVDIVDWDGALTSEDIDEENRRIMKIVNDDTSYQNRL